MAVVKSLKSVAEDSIIVFTALRTGVTSMTIIRKRRAAVSLVEVLIAMAILSMLALPMGMFLVEYNRGSSQIGDYYQVLNLLEQKLETALALRFNDIPPGSHTANLVNSDGKTILELVPAVVSNCKVNFTLDVEVISVDFVAMKDAFSGQVQRARAEDGMKRLEIKAEWGQKAKHSLNLMAYKADL